MLIAGMVMFLHLGRSSVKKMSRPAATVAFVPRPHLPSDILSLFCYFLLCIASVIMVFGQLCLLLGF